MDRRAVEESEWYGEKRCRGLDNMMPLLWPRPAVYVEVAVKYERHRHRRMWCVPEPELVSLELNNVCQRLPAYRGGYRSSVRCVVGAVTLDGVEAAVIYVSSRL